MSLLLTFQIRAYQNKLGKYSHIITILVNFKVSQHNGPVWVFLQSMCSFVTEYQNVNAMFANQIMTKSVYFVVAILHFANGVA